MTPALLPLSPPYSPGRMPSPAAQLPLTSTPQDPLAREAAELETQIMVDEGLEKMEVDGSGSTDVYNPLKICGKDSSSPLRRKLSNISDLKLSSPLLPFDPNEPLTKKAKTVSFAEELHTLLPPRGSDDISTDPFVAADDALAAVSALVEPLAQSALEKVNNERLVEIDTTARVIVPAIEDIEPPTPWGMYLGRHRALLGDSRATTTKAEKKWSGASSLERLLPWSPFPAHLGKPKPEGEFDDGSLARYLAELDIDHPVDLQAMVWKPHILCILGSDFDEEELEVYADKHHDEEPNSPHPPQGTRDADKAPQEQIRSHHFLPQQPLQEKIRRTTAAKATSPLVQPRKRFENSLMAAPRNAEPGSSSMQALLERRKKQLQSDKATFDANLLSQVNPRRSGETQEVVKALASNGTLSAFMAVQGIREMPRREAPQARQAEAKVESRLPDPVPVTTKPRVQIPVPQANVPKSSLPLVVSSTLMANRQLIRKLEQRLPELRMIERESTLTYGQKVESSSLAREADLTLSPSTGLMFTTLQKLKQRPLPGQEASFLGVCQTFARVATRYERLIVFLNEGLHSTSEPQTHIRTLDDLDSAAIADAIGHFSQLDTEVQVSYVPGGDEELANWIAAAVTRYAPCLEFFTLLDEETVWERFLRNAGMNVFAAQVVLEQLKPPVSEHDRDSSTTPAPAPSRHLEFEDYGLAAFVRMDVGERLQRFGPLIGGERMLKRVNVAIDGSFPVVRRGRDR